MKAYSHEIKYYECDRMGITHHSNYIRIMEEARVYWMDQLGYGFDQMEADGIVSPVVDLECHYLQTTTFKDIIEVEVYVSSVSMLKIKFLYLMKCKDKLVCKANSTHCFFEKGKPISLEQRFPELYKKIMDSFQKHDAC